ncbi:MAG TPA: M28 family metallopeptidase, partial [Nitrososphaeraceae archaeon]|nr:M28 family metallopeptidase [Nitrososphaeraceae archaeon]
PCGKLEEHSYLEEYPYPDKRKAARTTIFNQKRSIKAKSIQLDKFVLSKIQLVDSMQIQSYINFLTSFHNRHTKSSYINEAAASIKERLISFGYSEAEGSVFYHEYRVQDYELKNVVCTKKGESSKTIILCAHYDTILQSDFEDITSRAPGANDNASGVSALLEIARIMLNVNTEYTVQFVFFSGEEQGFWGSTHYAQKVKDENLDLLLVVNMDMCGETGFLINDKTTFIDIDDGNVHSSNDEPSKMFGEKMEQNAKDYTDLAIQFDPIAFSDYMPFEAREYVCIGAYDGSAVEHNSHYHDSSDVPSNINMTFLESVIKMVLSCILLESKYIV